MTDSAIASVEEASFLRGHGSLHQKIEAARRELLDLSTRNRLIHTPRRGRAKTVEVVYELAKSMYETLVVKGKRFTFEAGREELIADPDGALDKALAALDSDMQVGVELNDQPDVVLDESGHVAAHWDDRLQTRLTSTGLQRRLSDLYLDARTLEEEQGVNSLFLAVGYLRWRAAQKPNEDRFAPLVLVPVHLERTSAGERFHLKWSGGEIEANLSLQLHLEQFGMKLPQITDFESLDIDAYLTSVEEMVEGSANWGVERDDAVLGLFSFAKFMMYRDLDPAQWIASGGLEARTALRGVMADGFPGATLSDDSLPLDPIVAPADMLHVVDCDSSQALVVHDVRQGAHVLVQGPPGTGKSQTIANIIAAAVADGKRVLFVAEKMAALEVVKRRLDQTGIGVACLELHSSKANKRAFLSELDATWRLRAPKLGNEAELILQLTDSRDELNAHAKRLHRRFKPCELTPFDVLGNLVRLRREGHTTRRIALDGAISWTPHALGARDSHLRDLNIRIEGMGLPISHAWAGVDIHGLSPNDRDRALDEVSAIDVELAGWRRKASTLFDRLELPEPDCFANINTAGDRAARLADAPELGASAFGDALWETPGRVESLIAALEQTQTMRAEASGFSAQAAIEEDWTATAAVLEALPTDFLLGLEVDQLVEVDRELSRMMPDLTRLSQLLGEQEALTFDKALRITAIGEHAANVPDIERKSLVAHIWDRGVDTVDETIEALERLQGVKSRVAPVFRDAAWGQDLESARTYLATLGRSWLRWFNGDWRRANRQLRALLVDPKLPADKALASLDELLDGQAARRRVNERDVQAAEAFGRAWKRERSDVRVLKSISAWMRSLQPFGEGVRERLADVADRQLATELAIRLRPALEALQSTLLPLNEAFVASGLRPWGEETVLRRVSLKVVSERAENWSRAAAQLQLLNTHSELSVHSACGLVTRLVETQWVQGALEARHTEGESAFGPLWVGLAGDVASLRDAAAWMCANPGLRSLAARTSASSELVEETARLTCEAAVLAERLKALLSSLKFREAGSSGIQRANLVELAARLDRWRANPEGLPQWVAYRAAALQATGAGLGAFVEALSNGSLPTQETIGAFQLAYYEALWTLMTSKEPELHSFDGQQQRQKVEDFAQLDWDRMMLARGQVAKVHHAGLPSKAGAVGAVGDLLGEMAKKKRHMPIRKVMERCAPVVQAIKPVFMMSPLSVAQFLPPGALEFDMLVIDEASQVQPVDALGAVARARQLVIVGDERQLPPTSFFAKATSGAGTEEEVEGAQAADVESILGLCGARGLPERMLRWHYRSRHQSLIAISNREFYRNELFIVPSPFTAAANLGLRFTHVPTAIYDRGGARDNPVEAQIVAEAVIAHAKRSPELSLGVATFSTAQRRAIWDRVDLLRRQHPETEAFFNAHPDEPFFAKSLENVQGDERDVIYISVGYGRDAQNNLTMNFGPLSSKGGERRLNVLISRAKSRCEIYSSITDEDIDVERAKGAGVLAFKLFLRYARTGQLDDVGAVEDGDNQIFVEEVAHALKSRGYETRLSIGIAGVFVDIGVIHPDYPDRFVLGIECDGAWYRKSKSARDRERLRRSALSDKGWDIYRVWSAEWFQRPQAELDRLIGAIEKVSEELERSPVPTHTHRQAVQVEVIAIDRGEVTEVGLAELDEPSWVEPYREAEFPVPRHQDLHVVAPPDMADIVHQIVVVEGPVHRDEVVSRVRYLWGLGRAGGRIQSAVDAGIAHAVAQRKIVREGQHFLANPSGLAQVRDRVDVKSSGLRRPDYLPPSEVKEAIQHIVRSSFGAPRDEIVLAASRALGFRATSVQLRSVIENCISSLIDTGALRLDGLRVVVGVKT